MELRLNPSIPKPINLQLKRQPRTLNHHLKRKIQIIELHAPSRRQPREQALWHCAKVGRKCADIYKIAGIGAGWFAVRV